MSRSVGALLWRRVVASTRPATRICGTVKRTFICDTFASSHREFGIKAGVRLLSTPRMVGPPPQLFDFIIQLRFDEVLKRVRSHPHEVSYPHPRRWTALHACAEYGAPKEVIEALIQAYPDALAMKDWRGQTPSDVALTEELRHYLASLGDGIGGNTEAKGNESQAKDALATPDLLQHVDKMSEQVLNLQRQCDNLQDELRLLREALTKRGD